MRNLRIRLMPCPYLHLWMSRHASSLYATFLIMFKMGWLQSLMTVCPPFVVASVRTHSNFTLNVTSLILLMHGSTQAQSIIKRFTLVGYIFLTKHTNVPVTLNQHISTGVKTDWGLVKIGGREGVSNVVSGDTMEFTADGKTWEKMSSRYPGMVASYVPTITVPSIILKPDHDHS